MNNDINDKIEEVICIANRQTYLLSRDDIDSIVTKLRTVQQYVVETYRNRGVELNAAEK